MHDQLIYTHLMLHAGSSGQLEELCGTSMGDLTDLSRHYIERDDGEDVVLRTDLFLIPMNAENRTFIENLLDFHRIRGKDPVAASLTKSLLENMAREYPHMAATHDELIKTMSLGIYIQLRKERHALYSVVNKPGSVAPKPTDFILQTLWGCGKSRPSRQDEDPWMDQFTKDFEHYQGSLSFGKTQ
jgi:hypothetical protein